MRSIVHCLIVNLPHRAWMHIYFMGVCGTAMGNAALMMREAGHDVSGADTGVYPPMSDQLRSGGIDVLEGWSAHRLETLAPDLVVVGNVISRGNPEVEWLLETNRIPYTSLPDLLGNEAIGKRPSVVVAGTHGKTTTSTLTAFLLESSGLNPGWLIGGVPLNLPTGACFGQPDMPFVIEGDEYDSAFFDKRSKFVHYRPRILALNNLEFDHGDIFRDLADILRSFSHVIRLVPRGGSIVYNGDDENLAKLLPVDWCQAYSVGIGEGCDLRIIDFAEDRKGASFVLRWRGTIWGKVKWDMSGLFNARNAAVAALSAGLVAKPDDPLCAIDLGLLSRFKGIKRRQEILLENEALTVIEDFGHHPTAIAGTLQSLRARYPDHRLTACFEPRSNTAATNVLESDFEKALGLADAVYLGPVHRAERYAEERRLNTNAMAARLNQQSVCSGAFKTNDDLVEELIHATRTKQDKPRCVVFFSNGAFGGVMPRYVDACCE
ncbi:UDP-N-acetylmuramate--L-alanine ligase [Rubellicoccus peritrichatus]|uniref:Mur ligase family protein n=1 Tax=Rubellicoccus peritrichatus TaxID=3080537 RepID=A0AAQ3L5K1_9BACT|nr:Mur ligase family protein [Puniceicoccus sp. CR14]WOO39291.1 Mur ligase family protein [Puniceicoccus sp. CR14]